MVQREVAERLAAGPGSKTYGRLSIVARLYGDVELFRTVSRSSFYPVPEVEGRIFVHTARAGPLPVPNVEHFERIVRTLFSSRRKQLVNLLSRLGRPKIELVRLVREAEWPADWQRMRPEELPPEAYFRFATAFDAGSAL
jgi:16S rRNA (adenine1518-N6/adenine1519-N6)-dimethyltransferase